MNIRQLRYFSEVVNSGTSARAAERLFIAPTAISMQISQLEAEIGGALFDRSVKPMALTTLGQFFLPRARELLAQLQRLEHDARDVASGRRDWLGIGFVRSALYSVLPGAVRSFQAQYPDVKIELIEMLSEQQPAQLRSGRIHIGLSRYTHPVVPAADLMHTKLFEDAFVAALPAQHPLTKLTNMRVVALAQLPLISYPKDPQSSFATHVLSILHEAGAQPRAGHEAIEIHTALGLVAAGLGYALVGASIAAHGHNDVVFVELPELAARTTVLTVTRIDEANPLVGEMLKSLIATGANRKEINEALQL